MSFCDNELFKDPLKKQTEYAALACRASEDGLKSNDRNRIIFIQREQGEECSLMTEIVADAKNNKMLVADRPSQPQRFHHIARS